MGVCMSKFISLRILATLARSKKTSSRETPEAPPVGRPSSDSIPSTREEPSSGSRISASRIRVEG